VTAGLGELRAAVGNGRWAQVAALCERLGAGTRASPPPLQRLACQAQLHLEAGRLLGDRGAGFAVAAQDDGGLTWAVRRSLAAIDGQRGEAAAMLRTWCGAAGLGSDAAALWPDAGVPAGGMVGDVPVCLAGVVRPDGSGPLVVGESGSARAVRVTGHAVGVFPVRGTAVELRGRWRDGGQAVECESLAVAGQVPDYWQARAAAAELGARAGQGGDEEPRLVASGRFDPGIARARARRRAGERALALAAAELLDAAGPSLQALARVHALAVGPASARAGQLRHTPAVIRWGGVIVYRAPPVEAARHLAAELLRGLAQEASAGHPAMVAAQCLAGLVRAHPFADGNGRVARAVATWILLRSGFRPRGEATIADVLDANIDEHYQTLANLEPSPWGWHQLFWDAVLATFRR
jgi:fido (protein-threonine AMPylation protein)